VRAEQSDGLESSRGPKIQKLRKKKKKKTIMMGAKKSCASLMSTEKIFFYLQRDGRCFTGKLREE
jgi:hypothetical protein